MSGATLTLTDDDAAPGVTLSVASSSIPEGGSTTVSATLTHPSSAATTVTVTPVSGTYTVGSGAAGAIVIAAGSTTNATDTAAITAVDNDVDAADKAVTVTGMAANAQAAANSETMTVTGASLTIADDDTAGFVVSPTPSASLRLRTTESGETATFAVKLESKPTGDVVLGVASSDTTEGTVSPSSLTFTDSNWDTAQTVTLTGVDDAPTNPADGDQDYTVTLTVNEPSTADVKYDALSAVTVYAVNADNEFGLDVSSVTGQATEAGGQATFTVALITQPSQAVTVTVSSRDASEGAASPSSLTFATTAWNTAQTVTVTGADDAIDDGEVTWAVRLDPSSGAADYNGLANVDVLVTTTDDDAAPGVTLTVASSSIPENGGSTTVSAKLTHASSAATTVTVTPVSGSYTVAPGTGATIVIVAGSTTSADTATITAVDNDVDADDNAVTVVGTAANAQAAANSETMTVTGASLTLTDDDTAGFAVSPTPSASSRLRTTESGGMAEFEVKLESEPTGDVVLGVVSSDATEGAVSASSLTFTATTWSTAQTVTLTGVDDSTVDGNQNYTVTLTVDRTNTVDANYDALSAVTVYARNADNEYGLDVSSVTGQATEAGGTATFTVALNTRPTAAVTVSVSSRDTSEGAASPSSLTFAATAWNTAQTVTVTGADDAIDDGTVTWAVRLDPSSGDANYNGLSNVNVLVTTTDDDAAPPPPPPSLTATLSLSPSSISENGGVATVTATLTRASSAATTVTVTPVSGSYTVAPGTGATIVIAAGSTTSADTATITAVDNDVDAADSDVTVVGTASNSQGAGTVAGASLTITDDDTAGFAVSPTPSTSSRLRTTESGGMAEFEVKLESEPTGDVVLGVVSSDATEGTVSPTSLTFTATTWNTEQTVTLTGVDDAPVNPADGDRNYTVTVTVDQTSTVDANYDALSAVTVYAVNVDNESGLDVSAVTGQATEPGGTATFTVALVAQPSAAVTVTVTSRDTSEGTASPTSLTFETSDWSTAQTVTVTGVDDDVDDGDVTWAVRLDPSSGGDANYDGLDDEDVSVTTTDDDAAPTARLVLTPSTIDEGGTANTVATVTATLSRPSVAATTVTVTAAPVSPAVTGDYTLTGTTLTIAAGVHGRRRDGDGRGEEQRRGRGGQDGDGLGDGAQRPGCRRFDDGGRHPRDADDCRRRREGGRAHAVGACRSDGERGARRVHGGADERAGGGGDRDGRRGGQRLPLGHSPQPELHRDGLAAGADSDVDGEGRRERRGGVVVVVAHGVGRRLWRGVRVAAGVGGGRERGQGERSRPGRRLTSSRGGGWRWWSKTACGRNRGGLGGSGIGAALDADLRAARRQRADGEQPFQPGTGGVSDGGGHRRLRNAVGSEGVPAGGRRPECCGRGPDVAAAASRRQRLGVGPRSGGDL